MRKQDDRAHEATAIRHTLGGRVTRKEASCDSTTFVHEKKAHENKMGGTVAGPNDVN